MSKERIVVSGEAGHYDVEVTGRGGSSSYRVEVPAGYAERIGWGGQAEPEIVRESFFFLLEREPPSSILPRFRLDVICRYFPEYEAEMKRRADPLD